MDSSKCEYKRKYIPGKKVTDLVALILCIAIQSGHLVNCYKFVTPSDKDKVYLAVQIGQLFPSDVFEVIGYERLIAEANDKKLKQLRMYMLVSAKCKFPQDKVPDTDENEPLQTTDDKVLQNAKSTRNGEPLIVVVKPKDGLGETQPTQNETAVQTVNPEMYYLVVFKPMENQGTNKEMMQKWSKREKLDFVAYLHERTFDLKEKAKSFIIRYAKGHRNKWNLVWYKIGKRNKELIKSVATFFGISIVAAGVIVGFWAGMVAAAPATGGMSIIFGIAVTAVAIVAIVICGGSS